MPASGRQSGSHSAGSRLLRATSCPCSGSPKRDIPMRGGMNRGHQAPRTGIPDTAQEQQDYLSSRELRLPLEKVVITGVVLLVPLAAIVVWLVVAATGQVGP